MIGAEQERSAWVTPLQWDGTSWTYSWGSFQGPQWARRNEANHARAFASRVSLLQQLLKRNDKVVTLGDDTSILVFRRIDQLDCVVVDTYPPISPQTPDPQTPDPQTPDWAKATVSRA
jgi:hypothetical protein